MTEMHFSFTELQKLSSLALFSDPKSPAPWMSGVMIRVTTNNITAAATDRYVIAHYEISSPGMGLDNGLEADYLWLDSITCKALNSHKLSNKRYDVALLTYGDGVFSIEMENVTYKAQVLDGVDKRLEQMLAMVNEPVTSSFDSFVMNPSHLAKLSKISKNAWRFDRQTTGTIPPVVASVDGYKVVMQPNRGN